MPKYSVVMVETFGVEVEAKTSEEAKTAGRKLINSNPSKHHLNEYIKVKRAREEDKNVPSNSGLIGIDKTAK